MFFGFEVSRNSSIANKRSNQCHALSGAVEITVNKTRKDELR